MMADKAPIPTRQYGTFEDYLFEKGLSNAPESVKAAARRTYEATLRDLGAGAQDAEEADDQADQSVTSIADAHYAEISAHGMDAVKGPGMFGKGTEPVIRATGASLPRSGTAAMGETPMPRRGTAEAQARMATDLLLYLNFSQDRVGKSISEAVRYAVASGLALHILKRLVPHGEFERTHGLSRSLAKKYMQVADNAAKRAGGLPERYHAAVEAGSVTGNMLDEIATLVCASLRMEDRIGGFLGGALPGDSPADGGKHAPSGKAPITVAELRETVMKVWESTLNHLDDMKKEERWRVLPDEHLTAMQREFATLACAVAEELAGRAENLK